MTVSLGRLLLSLEIGPAGRRGHFSIVASCRVRDLARASRRRDRVHDEAATQRGLMTAITRGGSGFTGGSRWIERGRRRPSVNLRNEGTFLMAEAAHQKRPLYRWARWVEQEGTPGAKVPCGPGLRSSLGLVVLPAVSPPPKPNVYARPTITIPPP